MLDSVGRPSALLAALLMGSWVPPMPPQGDLIRRTSVVGVVKPHVPEASMALVCGGVGQPRLHVGGRGVVPTALG